MSSEWPNKKIWFEPIGDGREVKVDVRLITATNRNLKRMADRGSFRKDLYYRLKGTRIEIPPLRQRRGDISKLAVHFLREFGRRYRKPWVFTPEALRRLQSYSWPGNVRELKHKVREAAMLSRDVKIKPEALDLAGYAERDGVPDPFPGFNMEEYLGAVREKLFKRALELAHGNQSEAARLLSVSPAAVSKFVKGRKG